MDHERIRCITASHKDADIMSVREQGYSLPSLHSAMSAATYGTIAVSTKKKLTAAICIVLPIIIGISRIYLGVHYPTDVLFGWALGIVCIFALGWVDNRYGYKLGFLVTLAISASGFFFCSDTEFYTGYGVAAGLLLGFMYEEKRVNFEYCEKWWTYVLRPVGGVLVFVILTVLLKIPLHFVALEETSTAALIYRLFRYALSTFVMIGIYPKLFKLCKNRF